MDLVNETPFSAERMVLFDGDGLERLLVVVKATFSVVTGKPVEAEEQIPVATADLHSGDPARSGLREASDLAPFKPATDVLVQGFAYSTPKERTEVPVGLRFGALKKGFLVSGDRVWGRLGGASSPEPFSRMEISWERAFGGSDESLGKLDLFEDNPAGTGFRAKGSRLPVAGTPLPNIEHPQNLIRSPSDRPPAVGFGPIPPAWRPRACRGGTCDAAWRRDRFPLLPRDFDPAFHQAAPADQVHPGYVRGGEPMKVVGMTPEGELAFTVPGMRVEALARIGAVDERVAMACDTVLLDCERKLLALTWRGSTVVHGRVPRVRWIRVDARSADGS